MTHAEYAALPGANFSTLKALALSPAHYLARVSQPDRDSDPKRKGRAVHCAVFEPERFAASWLSWDGPRRGKEWQTFLATGGADYLLPSEAERIRAIAAAVRADPWAGPLVTGGKAEHVLRWTDAATGIECKARLDYLRPGTLADLKTCRDASPSGFGRAAARMHYHAQSAMYADGALAVTGQFPIPFLIAVEAEPPHVVQVYQVEDDDYAAGQETYRGWLTTLKECRAENRWPGYREGVTRLALPSWVWGDESDVSGLGIEFGETAEEG
jgi:hypothetical protein